MKPNSRRATRLFKMGRPLKRTSWLTVTRLTRWVASFRLQLSEAGMIRADRCTAVQSWVRYP